jgi:hypothetical protein
LTEEIRPEARKVIAWLSNFTPDELTAWCDERRLRDDPPLLTWRWSPGGWPIGPRQGAVPSSAGDKVPANLPGGSCRPVALPSDVVVVSEVRQFGGTLWECLVNLPDGKAIRVVVPKEIADIAGVYLTAAVVAKLYAAEQAGKVG